MYDVIVVGAGPSGSYISHLLAKENYKVLLLDRGHRQKVCTGIVSEETFQRFSLDRRCILRTLRSIDFVAPSGGTFYYEHPAPFAHVVDRDAFDSFLLDQAREAGVEFSGGSLVKGVEVKQEGVIILYENRGEDYTTRASVLVLATGLNSFLLSKVGLRPPPSLNGFQAEVDFKGDERVKVFLGREIAPGSFAWVVPLGNGKARVGLSTIHKARFYFDRFVRLPWVRGHLNGQTLEVKSRRIPCGIAPKTYALRTLLVGDVAGQVKTTTGGGIYYGLIGAEVASQVLKKAFIKGDFTGSTLGLYEEGWKGLLSPEIEFGLHLRELYSTLSDHQIDSLVRLASKDGIASLMRSNASFDWHKSFFSSLLRRPVIRKLLGL